jgi:hypothetical protein
MASYEDRNMSWSSRAQNKAYLRIVANEGFSLVIRYESSKDTVWNVEGLKFDSQQKQRIISSPYYQNQLHSPIEWAIGEIHWG